MQIFGLCYWFSMYDSSAKSRNCSAFVGVGVSIWIGLLFVQYIRSVCFQLYAIINLCFLGARLLYWMFSLQYSNMCGMWWQRKLFLIEMNRWFTHLIFIFVPFYLRARGFVCSIGMSGRLVYLLWLMRSTLYLGIEMFFSPTQI